MKNYQINKLIVVTRKDLTPGYQIAQAGHALAQFMLDYPDQANQWNNNYLICLSVENENQLKTLLEKMRMHDIPVSYFLEPDLGNEMTAIAFQGSDKASKLTSSIPLALKSYNKQ